MKNIKKIILLMLLLIILSSQIGFSEDKDIPWVRTYVNTNKHCDNNTNEICK